MLFSVIKLGVTTCACVEVGTYRLLASV